MTTTPVIETNVEYGRLIPHPRNPNTGDVGAIATMIEANGWHGAVVAQRSTGMMLAGNHRYLAAQKAGLPSIPIVHWVDVDEQTALRILLADNRASDLHTYDDAGLAAILQELGALSTDTFDGLLGSGFTAADLDALNQWDIPLEDRPHQKASDPAVAPDQGVAGRRDAYTASGVRSLVFEMTVDQFERAATILAELRRRTGASSNVEVLVALLEEAGVDG